MITASDEEKTTTEDSNRNLQSRFDITKLLDELLIEATIETAITMDKTNNSTVVTVCTNDVTNDVVDEKTHCITDSTARNTNSAMDKNDDEITSLLENNTNSSVIQQQQVFHKNGIDFLLEAFENSVCFLDDAAECSHPRDMKRINLEEQLSSAVQENNNNNNVRTIKQLDESHDPNGAVQATAAPLEKNTTDSPIKVVKQSPPAYHQQTKQQQPMSSYQLTKPQVTWWQKSAIRKAVTFLEEDLQQIVVNSDVIKGSSTFREQIPLFQRSEIQIGQLLGRGSFSDVYEIIGFQLDTSISQRMTQSMQQLRIEALVNVIDPTTGRGRYAIKQLQPKLLQKKETIRQFELAASDLIVESAYISSLQHPNIIAVRGLPMSGVKAFLDGQYDSYFIIFDRLDETLDHRIYKTWKCCSSDDESNNNNNNNNNNHHHQIVDMKRKTEYALQIANVVQYLHENRIIFRDLKPQNIGFASNDPDQIILFDFGLCRELPCTEDTEDDDDNDDDDDDSKDSLYEMSGVGTRRYMAPETINDSRYNRKADVYSWAIIYWEILTETRPYAKHSIEEHRIAVCQGGERPPINKTEWPPAIQHLLKQSWHDQQHDRFTMSEVCSVLRVILGQYHQQSRTNTTTTRILPVEVHHDGAVQILQENQFQLDAPPSPRGVIINDLPTTFVPNPPIKSVLCLSDFLESMNSTTNNSNEDDNSDCNFHDTSLSLQHDPIMVHPRTSYNELTVEYDYGVEVIMSHHVISKGIV